MKNKPVHEKVTPQTKETQQTNLDYILRNFTYLKELFNRGCVVAKVRDHLMVQLFFWQFFFFCKKFLLDIQQNHCKSNCCKTGYLLIPISANTAKDFLVYWHNNRLWMAVVFVIVKFCNWTILRIWIQICRSLLLWLGNATMFNLFVFMQTGWLLNVQKLRVASAWLFHSIKQASFSFPL